MLSKIEETRVKDFFNIIIRLNEKTEMEQSLLFIYSTYEGKDIEDSYSTRRDSCYCS